MQENPPDILITNVSMLSAMLNREVEAPVFEKTREWLERDDSYFYLILDELHLQRGAAGTEVGYLIRMLLQRLGLDALKQRHKVRVLASSASLPDDPPEEAAKSAGFLWDMFGSYGLGSREIDKYKGLASWKGAIVTGQQMMPRYNQSRPAESISYRPLVEVLRLSRRDFEFDQLTAATVPEDGSELMAAWLSVGRSLGCPSEMSKKDVLRYCIQEVSERIGWACWEGGRVRATPAMELGTRVFSDFPPAEDYDGRLQAIRALLFIRGCGDGLDRWLETASTPQANHSSSPATSSSSAGRSTTPITVGRMDITPMLSRPSLLHAAVYGASEGLRTIPRSW
jgi:hypothetical protein